MAAADPGRTPAAASAPDRWRRVRGIADDALDLPAVARPAYLEAACDGDDVLRAEVERLVRSCERAEGAGGFLDTPAVRRAAPLLQAAGAPSAGDGVLDTLRAALAGRYEVERELGRGGMATVYLARDPRHDRRVGLKLLQPALRAVVSVDRFLREIRLTARLTHPHVLPLHDSGEAAGLLYYVMPYVEGESLRARLARDGPLPLPLALRLLREVASALDYAHRQRIVHRDVKPENILLADDHAIVADFGIARALREAREPAGPDPDADRGSGATGATIATGPTAGTQTSVTLGTPAYMAPEQREGGGAVDHRADLYALGVTAYEMLAGVHPFRERAGRSRGPDGADPVPLDRHRPDVPPAVAALVHRCLAHDPDDRPQGAAELLRTLDATAATLATTAATAAAPARRASRSRRLLAGAGGAVAVVAAAGALVLRLGAGPEPPPRREVPADSLAHELYLKGRHLHATRTDREGTLGAIAYFDQAVAREPTFARGHSALADAHARMAIFGFARPRDAFPRAQAAARRALALDGTLAEAHAALAHTRFLYDYERADAERGFRRAIALDPRYEGARVPFAIHLLSQRRFGEALAQLDTARAANPLSTSVSAVLGRVLVAAGDHERAIGHLEEAAVLTPQNGMLHQLLGHAYLQAGRPERAIAALQRAAVLSGARDSAHLAYAYAMTGRRADARAIVDALVAAPESAVLLPFHLALAYTGLGDHEAAFRWLDRGAEERASFMDAVAITAAFAPLHADPRWPALLRRMRLE